MSELQQKPGESLADYIARIEANLTEVLKRADETHRETNLIAEGLAEEILHAAHKPLAA